MWKVGSHYTLLCSVFTTNLKENKFHGDPVAPPKHHGSYGPGMLLKKLLGPLKLLEFLEAVLEFLLKTP